VAVYEKGRGERSGFCYEALTNGSVCMKWGPSINFRKNPIGGRGEEWRGGKVKGVRK